MTRDEAMTNGFARIVLVQLNTDEQLNVREHEAIRVAIKSLERTEPQGVLYRGDGYYDGELVYDFAECPKCGYEYEESDYIWGLPFCPKCGQALKWEVEHDPR